MAKKKNERVDIRDQVPTVIVLESRLTINGGSIVSPQMDAVWSAVHRAFERASHKAGMGYSWHGSVSSRSPKSMEALVKRLKLDVVQPPSVAAVDAVVSDGAETSTRVRFVSAEPSS